MNQPSLGNRSLLLAVAAALIIPATAMARNIRVDFTSDRFATTGSGWPGIPGVGFDGAFDDGVDLTAGPATGSLLFTTEYRDSTNTLLGGPYSSHNLLVGTSSYDSLRMFEDGRFSLFSSGDPTAAETVFSVFDADLVSVAESTGGGTFNATASGNTSFTAGFSMGLSDAAPDPTSAVATMRFFWNEVTLAGDSDLVPYSFQAFIYFLGNGDFDLDLSYGSSAFDGSLPPSIGRQFISTAGTDLFRNTSALSAGGDYFFRFRNGVLQGNTAPPPTGVPEPSVLTLLLAGIMAVLAFRRRGVRIGGL